MESWLKIHEKGTLLFLHIQPGASTTELMGIHGERLKLKVGAPPQDGEANDAVIDYLALILKIPKKKIFILRGLSSRQKDILVELKPHEIIILLKVLLK